MATPPSPDADQMLEMLRGTIIGLAARGRLEITVRQLGILLTCYLEGESQTVRGLAEKLKISKTAITRAFDRLEGLRLARRQPDPLDGRSVLVARTAGGRAFLRDLKQILADAAKVTEQPE